MTTILPGTDEQGRFTGDRYERLVKCAEVLSSDPGIENSDSMFDGAFIRTYIAELVEHKVLDGLTERDSDTIALLITLDSRLGPDRIAWRIAEWINGNTLSRDEDEDNPYAVAATLAASLKIMLDAFVEATAAEEASGR